MESGLSGSIAVTFDAYGDQAAAAEPSLPAQETAPAKDPVEAGCGESFTAATPVVLAGGAAAAISSLKPGDKVTAVNTATGKTETQTVQAVMVKWDTDLYNLNVKVNGHDQTINTTANHLFYDLRPGSGSRPPS